MSKKKQDAVIKFACSKVDGGMAGMARKLGVNRQAIFQWSQIPPDKVIPIEKITGISRHDLRPDLHPRDSFAGDAA